jgi:hypothetical protein
MSLAARRGHKELLSYTLGQVSLHRRDAKGCVLPRALVGAEPISQGVGECGPVSDPPGPLVLPPVSLRIAGGWRADHSRDIVDTEPKMTRALLIARGGFIPDENRILRPADRPGRPPFLRPSARTNRAMTGMAPIPPIGTWPGFTTLLYSTPVT